jgi:hypothetical protein
LADSTYHCPTDLRSIGFVLFVRTLCAVFLAVVIGGPAKAEDPGIRCGPTGDITVELGLGFPLPDGFFNPTDYTVTFTIMDNSHNIFNLPSPLKAPIVLAPHTQRLSFAGIGRSLGGRQSGMSSRPSGGSCGQPWEIERERFAGPATCQIRFGELPTLTEPARTIGRISFFVYGTKTSQAQNGRIWTMRNATGAPERKMIMFGLVTTAH